MMKNKKWLIKIVVIIFVLMLLLFGSYFIYKILKDDGNGIIDIFTDNDPVESNDKDKDNVNGIYEFSSSLDEVKKIHKNCSVTEVKEYIAIINDLYRHYRSTCMGTFLKNSGNVTELMIQFDEKENVYKIKYDDKEFLKTTRVESIEPGNSIDSNVDKLFVEDYKYLLKETQFDGAYYSFSKQIAEGKGEYFINLSNTSDTGYFSLEITSKDNKSLYYVNFNITKDLDKLPEFYYLDGYLIVLDKAMNGDKYNDYFDILSVNSSNYYSLSSQLPIVIDGKVLDLNTKNRFVSYDARKRSIRLILGLEDKLCIDEFDDSKKKMPLYYEFEIAYDLASKVFSKPRYVKTGYDNEGCSYINKVIGEV